MADFAAGIDAKFPTIQAADTAEICVFIQFFA
jgi:hypothetical protein